MTLAAAPRTLALLTALAIAHAAGFLSAQEITRTFVPQGITKKLGGYRPLRAEMDKNADIIKVPPAGLEAPKYGLLEIDGKTWAFVLDEPAENPAKLYVDTNADGDLTNDPATVWEARKQGEQTTYNGTGAVDLGGGNIGTLGMYRFDPNDERRPQLKNTLMYYLDYGFEYTFPLDGQPYATSVAGELSDGQMLPIDRDGNGRISRFFEMAKIGEPFNFSGSTYVFSLTDGDLSLAASDTPVDQLPLPPNLAVGQKALPFTATTLEGKEVNFPQQYAGKIVMLDFWATWCGPCIAEIPNMKTAYEAWHDQGFEILGISFDQADMSEKVNEFLKEQEIVWPQIYEGKFWETSLGKQHDVSGIPFVLLVDGDSGLILGTSQELRGEGLSDFIGEQLKKKQSAVQ